MAKNTKGLGKGLDALFNSPSVSIKDTPATTASGDGIRIVKIGKVEPNRDQPRKVFDENDINELAGSIKDHGILQPILVTDRGDHFEIIAGERRWRAANVAGLKEVPVIVKDLTEEEIYIISLLENLQRKDLNPIDEAQAYKRLIDDYGFKQDEVAEKVYKSRVEIRSRRREPLFLCQEWQSIRAYTLSRLSRNSYWSCKQTDKTLWNLKQLKSIRWKR